MGKCVCAGWVQISLPLPGQIGLVISEFVLPSSLCQKRVLYCPLASTWYMTSTQVSELAFWEGKLGMQNWDPQQNLGFKTKALEFWATSTALHWRGATINMGSEPLINNHVHTWKTKGLIQKLNTHKGAVPLHTCKIEDHDIFRAFDAPIWCYCQSETTQRKHTNVIYRFLFWQINGPQAPLFILISFFLLLLIDRQPVAKGGLQSLILQNDSFSMPVIGEGMQPI